MSHYLQLKNLEATTETILEARTGKKLSTNLSLKIIFLSNISDEVIICRCLKIICEEAKKLICNLLCNGNM